MKVLVIGGLGYIGSHTALELVRAKHTPIILDNLANSDSSVLDRLENITGGKMKFYDAQYQNKTLLEKIIKKDKIEAVVHFAADKAVAESVQNPLKYYRNNVSGFIELLDVLQKTAVTNFVFSSSAAVYGEPPVAKVDESVECHPMSPYGWSKLMDEIILTDFCRSYPKLVATSLRYFNVVGADSSGQLGELPKGQPQNLLPIVINCVKADEAVNIFGDNYDTPDGTCIRDYIHVSDLARAHVQAVEKNTLPGNHIYNVGTGKGTSVLELIAAFETENNLKVKKDIGPRRPGDPAACSAVVDKIKKELGWSARLTINDAVRDAWHWSQKTTVE